MNKYVSTTDHEIEVLEFIKNWYSEKEFVVSEIPLLNNWTVEMPLYIGNPDASYLLVTHCDRGVENSNGDYELSRTLEKHEDRIIGILDNTACLALAMLFMQKLGTENHEIAHLITTSEEKGNDFHHHGGRGFIEYLDYHKNQNQGSLKSFHDLINSKKFICLDVRPSKNGQVGAGLVIRERENRTNAKFDADPILLNHVIQLCNEEPMISKRKFDGSLGITELGRGWEFLLDPNSVPKENYHVLWLQPPIVNEHEINEEMSINDLYGLWVLLNRFSYRMNTKLL